MNILKSKGFSYLFLFLIIAVAFFLRYSTLKYHVIPDGDEGSFLSLALNICEGKGFTNNVIWHFYNKNESLPYYEDTRHPLYPIIIAGLNNFTGSGIRPAQWLNLFFNLISILLVFFLGKKLHSVEVGFFASFLMAISWPQIKYSAYVYSEALFELITLIILLLYCKITLDRKDYKSNYFIIGIFLGLSYLCRPNGIFLFAAAVVIATIYNRKNLPWIISGFFLVSCWWMGRNIILFGNPIYGHFNHFMWIDSHHELWYKISDAPPNFLSFIRSHSIIEMMRKFFNGLFGFLSELWKFEGINLPLNKILSPFFIWFLLRKQYKKIAWTFVFTYFLITLLPIIWTASVIWVARYLLIYYPFYFIAVSIGLFEIGWRKFNIGRIKLLAPSILIIVVMFQYYPIKFLTSERNGDTKRYINTKNQIDWIKENLDKKAVILTGAITQNQYEIKRYMIQYPAMEELDKVISFSRKHGVTDFIVNKKLLSDAKLLKKYWDIKDGKIIEKGLPNYLERLYLSDEFGVYKINFKVQDLNEDDKII